MLEFIGELLAEFILAPIFDAVSAAVCWVGRTVILVALYPLMLFTGWFRLWLRERGQSSFRVLWQTHGHAGLHRFGWQEAALDLEYLMATLLIGLVSVGVCAMVYSLVKLAGS
ncbi:hypothetical protein AUC43_14195 [Hymenobacter sedentarius]|uniref:Uncharacterized protein n=1 Tax=Hymenobacter sedentarius TaxID=1411621 RepID=A0A0U4AZF6_9BACT|nr:hypothetical protein [Hymenobacter sedentarius]ALW86141.1 hypothetical protein AUC43_14195 [Hymenobacter sedentarius]